MQKNGKEEIEWIILDVDGNKALLISRYILDAVEYNKSKGEITWDKCSLRKWLNKDFFNKSFDKDQKKIILSVTWETNKKAISDKLSLLTVSDVCKYFIGTESRKCELTAYAGKKLNVYYGKAHWWLRSSAVNVGFKGNIVAKYASAFGTILNIEPNIKLGVRPAMWINISAYKEYLDQQAKQ